MLKFFLEMYINNMTKGDLLMLSQKYQVPFSSKEIDILFPIIKTDWRMYFDEEGRKVLIKKVEDLTDADCAARAIRLIDQLLAFN